ncbi:MAG TPA: hypothetical protein VMD29_09650 [Terracidiphilus sp.]|nr:hypothetical protein [Terracidiphilus sp.]
MFSHKAEVPVARVVGVLALDERRCGAMGNRGDSGPFGGRGPGRSHSLLDDVSKLVGEQPPVSAAAREASRAEHNMAANGIRAGLDVNSRGLGLRP